MGNAPQSGFYSTPAFELFRRGFGIQTVKRFRGINAYQSQAALSADWALDCLNVLVPGWGGLSKFRLPVSLVPAALGPSGPDAFFDFQKGDGTRQVVAAIGNSLYYYNWNGAGTALTAATLIQTDPADAGPWSMVESNNILFMANGQRMRQWTGTDFWNWGIAAPTTAPVIGSGDLPLSSIQRAGNVVTFSFKNTVLPVALFATYLQVGDFVTISNPADVSYNGTFAIASVVVPGLTYTYAQVGANSGPYANVATASVSTSSGVVPGIVNGSRVGGVATYTFGPELRIQKTQLPGTQVTISGFADATLNGTFQVATATGPQNFVDTITVLQPGLPDSVGGANGTLSLGVTVTTSRTYAISFENSTISHFSNVGPTTTIAGPLTNRLVYVGGPAVFPDPQVNFYQIFATLDGGGDLFFDGSGAPGASGTIIVDFMPDTALDQTIQGPSVNNPPPVGKYLAVGQSRIFIANLVGGQNLIAYTGYEQILFGRPEETSPPNNRLRLQIGAESVAGIGVIQAGVVAFSNTKRMYMLRGQVEDITVNVPVQFSSFLEELPWDIGTLSHQSIQSTPYGLLFWASDRTVQIFDGRNKPQDVSGPVYPLLRRATPGMESKAASCYFNWLERDWYGLTLAVDGSLTNNLAIFWSLEAGAGGNDVSIFPTSVQFDFANVLSTPAGQRILAISQGGKILNLPVSQDTVGGLGDPTVIPATSGLLGAFWKSGYFGNETPQRSKMFRWLALVTDQGGFKATMRLINNRDRKFTNPDVLGPLDPYNGAFSINRRAARVSVEIDFPAQDVSCNVLEISMASIATSDRR